MFVFLCYWVKAERAMKRTRKLREKGREEKHTEELNRIFIPLVTRYFFSRKIYNVCKLCNSYIHFTKSILALTESDVHFFFKKKWIPCRVITINCTLFSIRIYCHQYESFFLYALNNNSLFEIFMCMLVGVCWNV